MNSFPLSADGLDFSQPDLMVRLEQAGDDILDSQNFGIIGFDAAGIVQRYNTIESRMAGLSRAHVVGHHLFTVVAPCMNNFMVAQRFDDAQEGSQALDATLPYVLTLRMKPVKVKLRLLAPVGGGMRYVLVDRSA